MTHFYQQKRVTRLEAGAAGISIDTRAQSPLSGDATQL